MRVSEKRLMSWLLRSFLIGLLLVGPAWGLQPDSRRSSEADQQYRLGVALQQEGRTAEAIERFRACLQINPLRAIAYVRLKEAYGGDRTGDQLMAELTRRTHQNTIDFVSWNLLGVLHAKQGRWDEALAALHRAVQIQPADIDAWTSLGWLASHLGQIDEAREAFRRALTLDATYGRAHAGLAGLYAETNSNYDQAIAEYRLALTGEPDNPSYLYDMGWMYYRKGMNDEALQILTRASALSPDDPTGRTKIGWVQLRRKEYRSAIDEFERALQVQPAYTFARFGLARALQASGNSDAAATEYMRAWREANNEIYLFYLILLYVQRSLWMILLVGISVMVLIPIWLIRRRGRRQRSGAATEKGQ